MFDGLIGNFVSGFLYAAKGDIDVGEKVQISGEGNLRTGTS